MSEDQKRQKNASQRRWRAQRTAEQREKQNNLVRKWRASLTPQQRANQRKYEQRRRDELPNVRLAKALRCRLVGAIRSMAKNSKAVDELGCSIADFRAYIETKFLPDMTWKNWNRRGWHLDHIRPLASFDLTDAAQFKQASHYTNYQPLWAKDNERKGAKRPITSEQSRLVEEHLRSFRG